MSSDQFAFQKQVGWPMPLHEWKMCKLRGVPMRENEPYVLPHFDSSPALDFHVDDFFASDKRPDDLEKVLLRHAPSHGTFDSSASTVCSTSSESTLVPENIAAEEQLDLPAKRRSSLYRGVRYTIFTVYRRLFSLVFTINIIGLFILLRNAKKGGITDTTTATWASSNFLVVILVRQDFFVNALFQTSWLVPWSTPLRIRYLIANCYTYGGIHSAAAVAGTLWWCLFSVFSSVNFAARLRYSASILVLTWFILLLLVVIVILAYPTLRAKHHNTFEQTHRFAGWSAIILFWAQLVILVYQNASKAPHISPSHLLLKEPTTWNLLLISIMIVQPWVRLRKWTFHTERLSDHALRLHFSHRLQRYSALAISESPLREWHPFATFPEFSPLTKKKVGGSMVISSAGDFTNKLICEAKIQPQMQFWIKGSSRAGVLSLFCIFKRVVIVTTGSGIGPCMSSLLERPAGQFTRLVWSTPHPMETFGAEMNRMVDDVDPNAVVIDTRAHGRPDLVRVACKVAKDIDAEAVFVLSNEKVTKKVVYGLRSRGVAAYGPIFDS